MVRNPESKPRSSFGDRLRRLRAFGEKTLAIFGIVSTAIVGAGCDNSKVNDPNSNITPDTVATDTQGIPSTKETPPSPGPRNTEPPSPEISKEAEEVNNLINSLEAASSLNERRGLLSVYINNHIDPSLAYQFDSDGIGTMNKKNSAQTAEELAEWLIAGTSAIAEGSTLEGVSPERGKRLWEALTEAYFIGQAREEMDFAAIGLYEDPKYQTSTKAQFTHNSHQEPGSIPGLSNLVVKGTGLDGDSTLLCRDNFKTTKEYSKRDLFQYGLGDSGVDNKYKTNFGDCQISQVMVISGEQAGGLSGEPLREYTFVLQTSQNKNGYNKDPQHNQLVDYSNSNEVYVTPLGVGIRNVVEGSTITRDGQEVNTNSLPEVQESRKNS